jgi:hypothetical protein
MTVRRWEASRSHDVLITCCCGPLCLLPVVWLGLAWKLYSVVAVHAKAFLMRDRVVNINHFLHRASHASTTVKEHNLSGLPGLCTSTWILQELRWERDVGYLLAPEIIFSEEGLPRSPTLTSIPLSCSPSISRISVCSMIAYY